jgi:KaiC/GvpD/RAD55 family RecA-like ATPase
MGLDTGIEGLDELVDIPQDYALLIGGPPGTGKSAFAADYLFQEIDDGGKGLYITLRQPAEEVEEAMELRGHNPDSSNFMIQEATDLMRGSSGQVFEPEKVTEDLKKNINQFEPDRVVIDSITKFLMIFDAEPVQREEGSRLVDMLRSNDISSLFIGEVPFSKRDQPSRYEIMEFVVDGIFNVEQTERGIIFNILKMKSLGYDRSKRVLEITDTDVSLESIDDNAD